MGDFLTRACLHHDLFSEEDSESRRARALEGARLALCIRLN